MTYDLHNTTTDPREAVASLAAIYNWIGSITLDKLANGATINVTITTNE